MFSEFEELLMVADETERSGQGLTQGPPVVPQIRCPPGLWSMVLSRPSSLPTLSRLSNILSLSVSLCLSLSLIC